LGGGAGGESDPCRIAEQVSVLTAPRLYVPAGMPERV
jgi:hypothetical protein